jgi:zinc transport system substrate-binding protein
MKRYAAILLALALFAAALTGCGQAKPPESNKISVVCTIFPQYDWVRQIVGDRAGEVDLTLLLGSKTDLHNYQPTVDDIVKISNCDLFIYVGGESDAWVDDALAQAVNKNMITINLLEALGDAAKEEELLPGMEPEEEEEEGEEEEGPEYDEHVWLSLRCAQVFCPVIADALATLDPANAAEYQANAAAYDTQLAALDARYKAAVDAAPVKTLLFGDRFPFRYLQDDYGLECFAAFPGCSAETEASFETIAGLARRVDALGLRNVMGIESGDQSVAKTIVQATSAKDQRILALDSMQSVTFAEAENTAYLSIMESNLAVLKQALR